MKMNGLLIALFFVTISFVNICAEEIDVIKLSNDAVHNCATDAEAEARLKKLVLSPDLPEDDPEFIEFYECFCKQLNILDDEGNMNLDAVRRIYSAYITKKINSSVDAMQLTNEAIEHCASIPVSKPAGLFALKRKNCGNKFLTERLG